MSTSQLHHVLSDGRIDDVLLTGFIDPSETPKRFHASLSSYYFDLGSKFLSFATIGHTARGLLSVVSELKCDLDLDDDMEFAASSVKQMVMKYPDGSSLITGLTVWDDVENAAGVECSAVRIDLSNDQVIFLDPTYHFGVRIGGREQYEVWLENLATSSPPRRAIL